VARTHAGPASAISPNQESKRRQIVEAARVVLARDGLAGCTARTVADASPLTKSAINYYFGSIEEIVDLAVAAHVETMLSALHDLAQRHDDPRERLHAVLQAYLDTFAERPYAAFLWFEYWIDAGRRGATGTVEVMLGQVREFLAELLARLPVADPGSAAHTLLSWLLGSVVQQHAHPLPAAAVQAEVTRLLGPENS
jgi:AcrR family transcriptional regulator